MLLISEYWYINYHSLINDIPFEIPDPLVSIEFPSTIIYEMIYMIVNICCELLKHLKLSINYTIYNVFCFF